MYSFIRELSYSQSFPPTGFISKSFRSKIDFFRYNQLPPIKEEEGNVGQSDVELRNFPLCSQTSNGRNYKRGYKIDRGNLYGENERTNLIEELTKSEISTRSIPSLGNINCLMNVDMKQQSIWKTSFGKRLINEKSAIAKTISLTTIKNPKQDNEKFKENRSSDLVNFSQSFFSIKNIQLGIGDEIAQKKKKTKPAQASKKFRKAEKQKKNTKQSPSETGTESKITKTEADRAETSQETDLSSSESLINSLVMPRKSRNHNYLSHCVQNILGGVATQYTCKYCNEIFPKVEDLNRHQEKHETEKETCVLCSKIFYNFKEFTEHLLTHESVDKFSCKDCKKYFPSLKKYKAHFENVHLKSFKLDDTEIMCNTESTKEHTLKYVCKRCRLELYSQENFRDHRRRHIRFDLMGAYLLSNKSTLNY